MSCGFGDLPVELKILDSNQFIHVDSSFQFEYHQNEPEPIKSIRDMLSVLSEMIREHLAQINFYPSDNFEKISHEKSKQLFSRFSNKIKKISFLRFSHQN